MRLKIPKWTSRKKSIKAKARRSLSITSRILRSGGGHGSSSFGSKYPGTVYFDERYPTMKFGHVGGPCQHHHHHQHSRSSGNVIDPRLNYQQFNGSGIRLSSKNNASHNKVPRRYYDNGNQVYWMRQPPNESHTTKRNRSSSMGSWNYIRNVDDLLQHGDNNADHFKPIHLHRRRRKSDRTSWEYHTVAVTRVPGYGFGIAVSGGRDNPHFANGDPSIAVSDVLKGGPAEDRLQVNDRIISVNGVSLENVEYATAVQVLRDSGNTVTLVVKRRVPNLNMTSTHQHSHSMSSTGLAGAGGNISGGPGIVASPLPLAAILPGQQIKVMLTKASKKEDFGIVIGCRLFVKEITSKARDQLAANGYSLQEGDIITRIHNTNCNDTMSMKEAKKIIDGCKERLNLVVLRDVTNQNTSNNITLNNSVHPTSMYSHTQQLSGCSNNIDDAYLGGGTSYSSQNLYVQPPTRGIAAPLADEKNNLTPRGRSRGPLMDVSLSQLDRPSTPQNGNSARRLTVDEPPRPPPPRNEEFYSSRRQLYEDDPLQRSRQSVEPRFISFQKEGSVGIRLTGGNEAGIFVTAVQPGSPASLQGLTPGDKILKVNDMDMLGVTREEAVLFLLSLQDRIDLIVQHCKEEYEEAVANQRGDSFHIKTHFHCDNPSKGEMAFKAGDVFRVIDTLHNGVVGSWQVLKIGRGHQEMQRGVIPNKSRAEELATAQFNATKKEMNASESRGNFFRRRRSTHRRSKSLSRENWDDVVFSDSISKFAAYERVVLRHPGFVRPVVIFGPISDIAREKLIKDFPDKFTAPLQDDDKSNTKCRIVRLSNIRDIMDRGKHALLDITPNAVDRLNYAQFYPVVVFLKTDTKHVIKQLRHGIPKSAHKSSKKLLEQCQKLDKVWSHIFSSVIVLNDADSWYRKLREAIDLQQSGAVWMSESKLPDPPHEIIFQPYIAPPCNLPCCRPSYIPEPRYSIRYPMSLVRSLTPPPLSMLTPPPPLPSLPMHYPTVPIMKSSTSMPGGLGYPLEPRHFRTSQPNLLQSFGKVESTSLSNLVSSNGKEPNYNRRTPYYYNEIMVPPSVFDSNLNVQYAGDSAVTGNNATETINEELNIVEGSNEDNLNNNNNYRWSQNVINKSNFDSAGDGCADRIFPIPACRNLSNPVESLSDDFLFPMTTSRLSYASSPESDLELSPGPSASLSLGNLPQLVKSSSDPSIATNQDNLDRDRDIGEGLPPYAHPYDHSNATPSRRPTMDNKFGFGSPGNQNASATENSANRPQSIYGIHVPDLPPRIDRASKPPGGVAIMSPAVNSQMRNSNSSGTMGRSAQERLFGKQSVANEDGHEEYVTRTSNTNSMERAAQNSLDRQNHSNVTGVGGGVTNSAGKAGPPAQPVQNGSYDSVSSYDSYNTTQLSAQNIRLGPNAPDDLKSVPSANARIPPATTSGDYRTNSNDVSLPNRNSLHETARTLHDHTGRGFVPGGPNDLNRQSSPGRPLYDVNSPRNIDNRNANTHDMRGMNIPQRPSNLGLESSPRKQILETKTDYGKYSRNNSTSQADYNKSPKSPHVVPSPGGGNSNGNNASGVPFKPVPPPKPKNYRPPIQGQMNSGHWENAEPTSPRSPNGFFYPPTPSHYHHSQASGSPHNVNNNGVAQHPGHGYGHYNTGQQPPYPPANGYNASGHMYGGGGGGGQYMHRGHHPMGNVPSHHTPERHALDLAGSREQRGSAFELYRKPQIGTAGHHHNLSEMEPYERYYSHPSQTFQQQQQRHHRSIIYANNMNDQNYQNYYIQKDHPPPLPPPLPLPPKLKKKSMLKSPLAAIKNAFMKSTRPLRRMNSMVEPERKIKPCLRRQYSMMERNTRVHYAADEYHNSSMPNRRQIARHEPFQPQDLNITYQNLEPEDIYTPQDPQQENFDDLYANRALIDLERRQAESRVGGRKIIRRHSMADRTNGQRPMFMPSPTSYEPNDIYQSRQGAYMIQDRRAPGSAVMVRRRFYPEHVDEPIYQSRREMHRNHLYQSRKEMQERIAQGKKEIEKEFITHSSSNHSTETDERSDREPIYQSRRDVKDINYKTRSQLREQIYQSRRDAMESMAEPIYVSKRELKHEPIYECREETAVRTSSLENETDEHKEEKSETSIDETLATSKNSDLQNSNETVIENIRAMDVTSPNGPNETLIATPNGNDDGSRRLEIPATPRSFRAPFHISNIIKRTAPVPPIMSSRTSLETHYTSQASLPVGPPNASSTPYTSEMSLQAGQRPLQSSILTRETSTTRGEFDESGGTLYDNVWNVSLSIPPGALPAGIKQEIYFTVSDPRISEAVGGPPLDMENGETMLSPLVMCGPQGLEFLIPVTLNIPHCAGRTASLGLALKATDSEKNLQTNWDNIELPSNAAAHTVSVKVDHF